MKTKIVCAALAVFAMCTASAGQPAASGKDPKPPVKEATPKAGSADADQRYSEARPLPVRLLNTGKSDADTKQDEEERKEKSLNDRLMAQFTGGMFFIAVVQALLFLWQLTYMRRSLADTNIAAEAAKQGAGAAMQSVETMKDIAKRQLRAYVSVESASITDIEKAGELPVAKIAIKNFGQTPAYELTQWGGIYLGEFPLVSELPQADANLAMTTSTLPPGGGTYQINHGIPALTQEQIAALYAGTIAIYVYGEIRFIDAFGEQRYIKYRLRRGGKMAAINSTDLAACEDGNEEN